jgi:hypothetical protein
MSESSDFSDDDIYYVEHIVDKKIEKGRPLYLIKWQGFPTVIHQI